MEDGMIVVDPHAFEDLWPALGIWLVLFLTAGDGTTLVRRQAALHWGEPATVTITAKKHQGRRNYAYFDGGKEAVGGGKGWALLAPGQKRPAHRLRSSSYLDDDFGYSRFKWWLFGGAFWALWLWAAARYRFG